MKLRKGYEILYKYSDGDVVKFRTTNIIKSKKDLDERVKEITEMPQYINLIVRSVEYCENMTYGKVDE